MTSIRFTPEQVRAFVDHDEVPDEVRCPVSCDLMQHPVRVAQNPKSVYSRDSLAAALAYRLEDPKTRAPLTRAGVAAAPQQRRAVHELLLQAAGYAEARAAAPGVPAEEAAKAQKAAQKFRTRQAFYAWREEHLPPLPADLHTAIPALPAVGRAPFPLAAPQHRIGPHAFAVAMAEPEPEPTTLLGRICQHIANYLARALVESAVRS